MRGVGKYVVLALMFMTFSLSPSIYGGNTEWIWENEDGGHIITVPEKEGKSYPILDTPVAILGDGKELNRMLEQGFVPPHPVEVIYLSTGSSGKGIIDISPIDGTHTGIKGESISDVIPEDFGPVVSSVKIYHDITKINFGGEPFESLIFITSTAGKVLAIKVQGNSTSDPTHLELYTMKYELSWVHNIGKGESISQSVGIFYGKDVNNSDDRIVVVGDSGTVVSYSVDGEELWEKKLDGSGFYSPIPVDAANMVVFGSKDGHFYGLNASDGSIIWTCTMDGVFSSPYISYYYRNVYDGGNASMVVGSDDGYVYKIGIYGNKSGKLLDKVLIKKGCMIGDIYVKADTYERNIYGGLSGKNGWGGVFAISEKNFSIKWKHGVNGGVLKRPACDVISGLIFYLTENGILYGASEEHGMGKVYLDTGMHGTFNSPLILLNIPKILTVPRTLLLTSAKGEMEMFYPHIEAGENMSFPWEPWESSEKIEEGEINMMFIAITVSIATAVTFLYVFKRMKRWS